MVEYAVVRGAEAPSDGGVTDLVTSALGAVHLDVAVLDLEPGASQPIEANPYEESFYVLEGVATLQMAGRVHELRLDDFGFVPVAMPHRWENRSSTSTRLLRVRSPQPRQFVAHPREAVMDTLESEPIPIDPSDPTMAFVGHFDGDDLPAPGPMQMKGFRSAKARNVGLWMMVDEVLGAVHHTLFMVQFFPTGQTVTLGGQHYHPFEEIYYIVEGEAIAHLEDESIPVGVGDVVFAGVNALHGFSNQTDSRVRWIEAQAPAPPPAGAFFFPSQWGS